MSVASSIIQTGCEAISHKKTNSLIVTLLNLLFTLAVV